MRSVLILGGTAWLGREIAEQLVAQVEEVTCLAHSESGTVPSGVTFVRSDRRLPRAYDSVAVKVLDEIIELSYETELVEGALEALAGSTQHLALEIGLLRLGVRKQRRAGRRSGCRFRRILRRRRLRARQDSCETRHDRGVGDRLLIVRPGLITGPGDMSDRFSYWVSRLALALDDPVLVPDSHGRYVQFIDVRDRAGWLISAGHRRLTGIYNAVGSSREVSTFLMVTAQVAGHTGDLIFADDGWLNAHNVNYWAGPRSLPLWLPRSDAAFARRSRSRFLNAGGTERNLMQTLEDVLADKRARGLNRERRSGLTGGDDSFLLREISGEIARDTELFARNLRPPRSRRHAKQ